MAIDPQPVSRSAVTQVNTADEAGVRPCSEHGGFEDYDSVATTYDHTRQPVGVELHLGFFTRVGRPLTELTILDAGCGTGSYAAAVAPRVGRIIGLDLSRGMLAVCKRKLARFAGAAALQGAITDIPLPDRHVDGVMLNQVIHHLPPGGGFAALKQVFAEAARVLRPHGVFVVHTTSRQQLMRSYWWAHFIPKAVARLGERLPVEHTCDGVLESMGREAGLRPRGVVVPVDCILQGNAYLNAKGPFRKEYRDGDSTWTLATEPELDRALQELHAMIDDNTIQEHLDRAEESRETFGQCVFVWFQRVGH
ncbi:class I SAM-dependent methyltransferase [Planctomycetota bacterium]